MSKKNQNLFETKCNEAIIFARVSSEKQEKGASIDAQKECIYEYCKSKGLKIIKEYIITESTMRGDRKQYKEMIDFIKNRKQKTAIVVNCVDRLQRSYGDTPILDDMRKKGKLEIHFMKECLILSNHSTGMDILFWNMCVLMANSYVLSLSDNVRRSLEYNWAKGKWQGLAPLGYLNTRDNKGNAHIIIDEERAPIIKRMFEEYATGLHSAQSLLTFATHLGLTARTFGNTNRRPHPLNYNTVYEILRNPFYYGVMKVKGKLIPHIYDKIIDKKLYDRVQLILEAKSIDREFLAKQQKYKTRKFAFRSIIRCGKCNHFMSPDCKIKKNKMSYVYFRCYNNCGQPSANSKTLLNQLDNEVFSKFYISDDDFIDISRSVINHNKHSHYIKQEILIKFLILIRDLSYIMKEANAGMQNEILTILLKDCSLNGKTLSYNLRSPFDKLLVSQISDWKDIIINNIKDLEAIEYNIKALDLVERK